MTRARRNLALAGHRLDAPHYARRRGCRKCKAKQERSIRQTHVSVASSPGARRRRFRDNQARFQLFAVAYNLANFLRQLVLPRAVQHWTLTTLREKLIKIGAKVVSHAKYIVFQLAEVAVPRKLFARILDRIARLRPACAAG
jgi:hypothetical protein